MKEICFIEPPYHMFMESLDAPFTLMYLAAIAEQQGWNPSIIDMQNLDSPLPDADIYAVTSSSPQWPIAAQLSQRLTKEHPESMTIVGGNHISAEPSNILKSSFDHAVLGEGEKPLKYILSAYPRSKDWSRLLPGEPVLDLDTIPFPARHLVDFTKYKRGIFWGKKRIADAVSMITSRGCPFSCAFCGSHIVFGHRTRFRSTQNVVVEIKQVLDTLGYRGFNFHDDTFAVNKHRVFELCKAFRPLDIVWRCLTRASTVDKMLLEDMAAGGCREIILGVESGSQKILDNLHKQTTVKQNRTAMKLIKENPDIQLKAGIIVGSPGETWDTISETVELLREYPPDFWNVNVFTPYPGSDVWRNPKKYDIKILSRDLTAYAMVGLEYKGNVNVETSEMTKQDIEDARDMLIELLLDISGPQYDHADNVDNVDNTDNGDNEAKQ